MEQISVTSKLCVILLTYVLIFIIIGGSKLVSSQGDAEFWRLRNFLPIELNRIMDIDTFKLRNYQVFELSRTMNADLLKLRNYLSFELTRTMNADIVKLRNYQIHELIRTMNADVIKLRNYQAFEMTIVIDEYILSISNLETTDQNNNPKTNFLRGDIVQFHFSVENTGNPSLYNGLISIEVLDPSENVVFISYLYDNILHGSTEEFFFGYKIPAEEPTGTHTIRAMILTDWPSEGGIGLAIEEATFNVS